MKKIPDSISQLCQQWNVIPVDLTGHTLTIATDQPNPQRDAQLRVMSGLSIVTQQWNPEEFQQALPELELPVPPYPASEKRVRSATEGGPSDEETQASHLLDNILQRAADLGASDIHLEPTEHDFQIRIRVDGVLHYLPLPISLPFTQLNARIKVLAQLDITERRRPQDGVLQLDYLDKIYSIRVSTLPTQYGEKTVLRLQERNQTLLHLHELGMNKRQIQTYSQALSFPQGMILVTGPTGSGKTLTLYSGLQQLDKLRKNISSVEDPIEIPIEGINQTAINPKIELSFSQVLRALLRQDPDVIMVGEIRDNETADIAIRAAQTGHLVLSTLHTNSALEALMRLRNMGIPSYLIVASLKLIIAQRLVRLLCTQCRQPLKTPSLPDSWQLPREIWQAEGCEQCLSGYKGRMGIFEMLSLTPEIQQAVVEEAPQASLTKKGLQQGETLLESGLQLVRQGLTSLSEIHRVIGLEDSTENHSI